MEGKHDEFGGPTLWRDRRLQGSEIAASGAAPRRPNPSGAPTGWRRGAVAQMGERCNRTAEVRGSIPLSSTSHFGRLSGGSQTRVPGPATDSRDRGAGFRAGRLRLLAGVMIDDARWQYQQAVDNQFEDWHPPLMAWAWRRLAFIVPGPAPMLLLQLLLYWGGIGLIAWWAWRRGQPGLAVAIACAGWVPAPLALTGTVIKDALMTGFLLVGSGLLLSRQQARARRRSRCHGRRRHLVPVLWQRRFASTRCSPACRYYIVDASRPPSPAPGRAWPRAP